MADNSNEEKTYANLQSTDYDFVDNLVANNDWNNSDGNNVEDEDEDDWEIPDISSRTENGAAGDKENLEFAGSSTPINVDERFKEIDANAMAAKNAEEEKNLQMEKQDLILKRKKRVKFSPPGLKIFKNNQLSSSSDNIFFYFSRKDLDIEKDFFFQRKQEIMNKFGVEGTQTMNEMLHTPWKLIVYISAETNSPLIQNEQDFGNICIFFFYLKKRNLEFSL